MKSNANTLQSIIRLIMPRLETTFPRLAGIITVNQFIRPITGRSNQHWKPLDQTSWKKVLKVGSKRIMTYSWGFGNRHVLLVHGWGGNPGQFSTIIKELLNHNYKVTTFDLPAHGLSSGSKTNIVEISDTLLELERDHGRFDAVITHGFGALCALYARKNGFQLRSLTSVAPPFSAEGLLEEFARRFNVGFRSQQYLIDWIQRRFGLDFFSLDATFLVSQMSEFPIAVIHDEGDSDASIHHSREFACANPGVELLETTGLGHRRILREPMIVGHIIKGMRRLPGLNAALPNNLDGILV